LVDLAPPEGTFNSAPGAAPSGTSIAPDVSSTPAEPPSGSTASSANVPSETPPPVETAPPTPTPERPAAEPEPPPVTKKAQPRPAPAPPVMAMVSFTSEPPGSKIVVDSNADWACTAPCRLELPAGDHTAVAASSGYYPARRSFRSAGDAMDVSLKPDPIVGTVMVSSTPSGVDIYVDGVKQNRKTNAILKLKPGSHVVRIQGPGITSEKTVQVGPNETATLQFTSGTQ